MPRASSYVTRPPPQLLGAHVLNTRAEGHRTERQPTPSAPLPFRIIDSFARPNVVPSCPLSVRPASAAGGPQRSGGDGLRWSDRGPHVMCLGARGGVGLELDGRGRVGVCGYVLLPRVLCSSHCGMSRDDATVQPGYALLPLTVKLLTRHFSRPARTKRDVPGHENGACRGTMVTNVYFYDSPAPPPRNLVWLRECRLRFSYGVVRTCALRIRSRRS